jgi:hypothetical protein
MYKVVIDGEEVGRIGDGDELDIPVSPGEHSLRLKIDWTGSKQLEFSLKTRRGQGLFIQPIY